MSTIKGLKEYIEKHGKHFTKELANDIVNSDRCVSHKVEIMINKEVWYNVTSSTVGDIIYLYSMAYYELPVSKRKSMKYALSVVEDVNMEGIAFSSWLGRLIIEGRDFDFKKYV